MRKYGYISFCTLFIVCRFYFWILFGLILKYCVYKIVGGLRRRKDGWKWFLPYNYASFHCSPNNKVRLFFSKSKMVSKKQLFCYLGKKMCTHRQHRPRFKSHYAKQCSHKPGWVNGEWIKLAMKLYTRYTLLLQLFTKKRADGNNFIRASSSSSKIKLFPLLHRIFLLKAWGSAQITFGSRRRWQEWTHTNKNRSL